MTENTKELIELSGQLDWRVRNGKLDDAVITVKAIQFRLNKIKEELQSQKAESKYNEDIRFGT